MIFVDQENGDVVAPKSQPRLPSGSSKALSERTKFNTPLPKKITATPARSGSVRRALGNVNRSEGVLNKKTKIGQPCPVNKANEKAGLESCTSVAEEDCPEIENMFPFDPQDFESFDLPEEYKLSNLNLCGVPLMVFDRTYERCVNMVPSPVKFEQCAGESTLLQESADFLATLDKLTVDMPPPLYDSECVF
ncbi:securin [Pithys albifrons albifrons]|uniref:securin n=1 Tax=Pithys albifrons albifrons TaxID=3385563 RepID=UPI003A5CD0AC